MKKLCLIGIFALQTFVVFAQYSFPTEKTKIEHAYSYNSTPISESFKIQDLKDQNIRVEVQKQSAADYYATKQFEFKPSGENVNLSIKAKRIKTKNADMDIDTDIPFGTNPGSKMALDHYLSLLENMNKVTYTLNKIETDKTVGISISALPLLHPIYELSGVLLYQQTTLSIGQTWTDTLENKDGKFVNTYKVLKNDEKKSTISLVGYLEPNNEKIVMEPFDRSKHMTGAPIEAQIRFSSMDYKGEMLVWNENGVIEKVELEVNKDFTIITPTRGTQRANNFKITINNTIK